MPSDGVPKPSEKPTLQAVPSHVLIVDDDRAFVALLTRGLQDAGYAVSTALTYAEGSDALARDQFDLVLLDLMLPDGDGLDLLRAIRKLAAPPPVVMISGHSTIRQAVQAIRAGARDFLEKPLGLQRAVLTVRNTLAFSALQRETLRMQRSLETLLAETRRRYRMVGMSPAIRACFSLIDRFAPLNALILITGETGVGKELAARAIHLNSKRASAKFITVSCSNISDDLLESELFGHRRGAFTGAISDKMGYFQAAHGGTLFLDEIGELTQSAQAKILRAVESGEVTRMGEVAPEKVDVRLIAATNKNLQQLMREGRFRKDLYYRLEGMNLHLPPLRERREDIRLLAGHFFAKFCRENALPPKELDDEAHAVLQRQEWQGNVRELVHFVGRLAVFADGEIITGKDVRQMRRARGPVAAHDEEDRDVPGLKDASAMFEKAWIESALERQHYTISRAAAVLGIKRPQLYRKMRHFAIPAKKRRAKKR